MKCKSVEQLLPEYIEGTLSPKQVDQLECHLDSCFHCQRELEAFEKVIHFASSLPVEYPPPEVWENFWPQLRMKLEQGISPETNRFSLWIQQNTWKLVSGMCLLVFLASIWGISSLGVFKAPATDKAVSLETSLIDNFMKEIPVKQLQEQLDRELQGMDGTLNLTEAGESLIVDEIQPQSPTTSRELLNQLLQVVAAEVDLKYFGDEELTDSVSSGNDEFVLVSRN